MAEKKETYTNYGLECPHCGYLDTDTCDIFSEVEECIAEYECARCGKVFMAERTCTFAYTGTVAALPDGSASSPRGKDNG